jgi:hypothetical protein
MSRRDPTQFGRTPRRLQPDYERIANRRAAIAFAILGAVLFGIGLATEPPAAVVLCIAGLIFLFAGAVVAGEA